MAEQYRPERLKWLGGKALSSEEIKQLDRFRDIQKRWHDAFGANDKSFLVYKSFLKQIRNFFDVEAMFYLYFQREQHGELESQYAKTQEGQLELAHKEANLFLDALGVRAARVEEAYKNKDTSPEGDKVYKDACNDLEALKNDLRNTDLSQYREAIEWRTDLLYALGELPERRDLRPTSDNANKPS